MKNVLRLCLLLFFAMSLALAGCSDGKDGRAGVDGSPGQDGQDSQDATVLIPGTGVPASYSVPEHAAPSMYINAEITQVNVITPAETTARNVEVTFNVPGYPRDAVRAEFTLAMWDEIKRTWVNMLPRQVGTAPKIVIRGGNLRMEGDTALTKDAESFTTPLVGAGSDWGGANPIDFSDGPVWRRAADANIATYAPAEGAYRDYVQAIMDDINGYTWSDDTIYRVGVTSRTNAGQPERFNAVAYFDGAGNPVTDPEAADVRLMDIASCTSCHGEAMVLNAHSGQRHDPNVCTSCHNSYTFDRGDASVTEPDGWASLDMMVMIHKIHAGLDGYTVDSKPFGHVNFPDWLFGRTGDGVNGTQNCTACHKGDVPEAQEDWNIVAYNACFTCHSGDRVVDAFPGAPASFSAHTSTNPSTINCATCHNGQLAGVADNYHGVSAALSSLATARSYAMEIVSVENAVAGQQAVVTWRVEKDGVYQDLFTGADTYLDDAVRLGIGWGVGDDWTNDGSGNSSNGDAGRPFQTTANTGNTVAGVDNTVAVTTFPALPMAAAADRNGFAVVEHGPAGINVSSALKTLTLGEGVATLGDRRAIVSTESCLGCHTTIGRHGTIADAASGVTSCATCHNAGSLSRDASVSQGTVDMMFIMHAIHGVGEAREKFDRRRDHGYDYVTYPNTVLDCNACHVGNSHKTVDYSKRLGVIADGGKEAYDMFRIGVNSPMGSVCLSCHEDNAGTIKAHFMTQGANMSGLTDHESYAEGMVTEQSCNLCHK